MNDPLSLVLRCSGRVIALFLACGIVIRSGTAEDASALQRPDSPVFETDVLPILKDRCVRCHSQQTKKAELDLSTVQALQDGGESGEIIVPGNADESLLYEMVRDQAMPPEGEPLADAEIETIRRWIAMGGHSQTGSDPTGRDGTALSATRSTQHDVIPILLRRCTMCHGPQYQEGELDLRSKSSILRGGKSGPAVVPGDPDSSRIIQRIRADQMPPRESFGQAGIEPLTADELAQLERWITEGCPEEAIAPDVATVQGDPLVADEDRQFWSFQSPGQPQPPTLAQPAEARHPIDRFLLARLQPLGLSLAPSADRLTLLRRASFDLTGLPPDPEAVQAFLADHDPNAYEKALDRLLGSIRYGERWGRIWLDVAGYADSEGKRQADMIRPFAYRYRDYVIRSLNDDKPYDQFLTEQLAGDELVDYSQSGIASDDAIEKLVATGFLRMVPDGTSANTVNRLSDRVEVQADEIDVLSRGVMGLTMRCARCHSHKYDPIPQRDYYRFLAIFKGAYDEYDWMTPQPFGNQWKNSLRRFLTVTSAEDRRRWESTKADIQGEIQSLSAELKQLQARQNANNLTQTRINSVKKQINALKEQLKNEPRIRALWDRGRPSPTYIYRRGDPLQPTRLVGPGVPSVLTNGKTPFEIEPPAGSGPKTGRRLALARWLVQPDHPLTARVLVNRVWRHHFGTGIVKSLDNFGRTGTPPSHPQLLDWLAVRFVRDGWSIKKLHRLMMTSAAYRQTSRVSEEQRRLDPDNRWVSRMPMRRMSAEEVRDTILLVADRLNQRPFGRPDQVEIESDGLITSVATDGGWRRSVYVRQRRKEMPTILETFDLPQMNPNCLERTDSTIVSQPLYLMNNKTIYHLAAQFAERIQTQVGPNPLAQTKYAFLVALSRPPSNAEIVLAEAALAELRQRWQATESNQTMAKSSPQGTRALADLCHGLINSAAFLYID